MKKIKISVLILMLCMCSFTQARTLTVINQSSRGEGLLSLYIRSKGQSDKKIGEILVSGRGEPHKKVFSNISNEAFNLMYRGYNALHYGSINVPAGNTDISITIDRLGGMSIKG